MWLKLVIVAAAMVLYVPVRAQERPTWLQDYPQIEEALAADRLDQANLLLLELGRKAVGDGQLDLAVKAFKKGVEVNEQIGNPNAVAFCLMELGNAFEQENDYDQAITWYKKALSVRREMGDEVAEGYLLVQIARVMQQAGKHEEAVGYAEGSLKFAQQESNHGMALSLHKMLSESYGQLGREAKALEHQQAYINLFKLLEAQDKEALSQKASDAERQAAVKQRQLQQASQVIDSVKTVSEAAMQQAADNARQMRSLEAEKKRKDLELREKELHIEAKNNLMYAFSVGLIALLLAGCIMFFSLRQAWKNKKALQEQNDLISKKNEEISRQSLKIRETMTKLNASLCYAKRIQAAMLPSEKAILDQFKHAFVLFKPRELVSGDFIWHASKGDKYFLAVADCTGHGVPGSLMTMLGTSLLEQAIEIEPEPTPDRLLNFMNINLRKLLRQEETQVNDGMDISLICYHTQSRELQFAGAKNPLLMVSENGIEVIKGDKFPIGGQFYDPDRAFTLHTLTVEPGTTLYLYSDGFQDQFGGDNNKKYMSKRFRKLLVEQSNLALQDQREALTRELETWMGNGVFDQVDDITVVGLKIA